MCGTYVHLDAYINRDVWSHMNESYDSVCLHVREDARILYDVSMYVEYVYMWIYV